MWVFRRFGYTEAENPEHMFAVMAGAMPIPAPSGMFHQSDALEYTVDELLTAFEAALDSRAWRRQGKPEWLAVDVKGVVDRMDEILTPAGCSVNYYPPPSEEELSSMGVPRAHW